MKRLSVKKALCLLPAVLSATALLLTAGCGNQNSNVGDGNPDSSPEGMQESSVGEENTAMGRYAEVETDLTEELEVVREMRQMPDGTFIITDITTGIWESKDQGMTWEKVSNEWLDEKMEHSYFMAIKMAPDGTLGVIYDDYEEEAMGDESGDESEPDQQDGSEAEDKEEGEDESEADGEGEESEESEEEASIFDFAPICELIKPDGTVIPVDLAVSENEMYPDNVWISDSGRIFVTTLGDIIYEISEDGSSRQILTAENRPQLVQFQENLMIVDGYDYGAPLLYDMEKEEIVEEPELDAFVRENYPDRGFNGGSWYDLYIFPGKDGELYLAGDKGLHRYEMGEGSITQLIDGSLSRLGNPLFTMKNMMLLESGEFLAVSSSGKLVRFTYDPDMPSVPSENLKVYSLEDSYSIRTAISLYQINHPEVYVEYEVGMAEGDAVTREDALKKLNTQIMAGEGPDVLMMDGLPMDSYMEKGLLLDLTDLMADLSKEIDLYENLYQAMAEEGKVYVVPTEVHLPVMLGREKYVSGMKDLASIADEICRIREDNPEKDIIYLCEEKEIMKAFAPIAAPVWKDGNGEINEKAIGEFLTQMKRIYDAQMNGLNEKSLEEHQWMAQYNATEYGEDWMYDVTYSNNEIYFVGDYLQCSMGVTTYPYGYWGLPRLPRTKDLRMPCLRR